MTSVIFVFVGRIQQWYLLGSSFLSLPPAHEGAKYTFMRRGTRSVKVSIEPVLFMMYYFCEEGYIYLDKQKKRMYGA